MRNIFSQLSVKTRSKLRNFGRMLGFEIRLNSMRSRDDVRLLHFLKMQNINLVLDVGANKGQFARQLFELGYDYKIASFEPLLEAHTALIDAAKKFKDRWIVGPRVALSDKAGTADFHVTLADTASSLYLPSDDLIAATPETRPTHTVTIPTARLDSVVSELGLMKPGLFLKLDVQGAESLVLAGAPIVLAAAKGLITELSLTPLYDGQPPARDVLEIIYAAGFEVWDVWQGYRNPKTHRLNQIDLVCFKPPTTNE